jgi:G:T/U-mismatch repair DNA glycosylase
VASSDAPDLYDGLVSGAGLACVIGSAAAGLLTLWLEWRERFEGAQVWVLPNPSGLNANYQLPALVQLFRSLWQQSSTGR